MGIRGIIIGCVAMLGGIPVSGAEPSPDQGKIDGSGKFVPSTAPAEAGKGTPAELERKVQEALAIKPRVDGTLELSGLILDPAKRQLRIPATVRMRDGAVPVEYALVHETGKVHESLLSTKIRPMDIQIALLLLGLKDQPLPAQCLPVPAAQAVQIVVSWEKNGPPGRAALTDWLRVKGAAPGGQGGGPWFYNGSAFNPAGFAAQQEGSVISLIRDGSALLNNPHPDNADDAIHFPAPAAMPAAGAPVTVIFTLAPAP